MSEMKKLLEEQQKALQADIEREKTMDASLSNIAKQILDINTLVVRGRDGLDFHDVGVAALKVALKAAYDAGRNSVR